MELFSVLLALCEGNPPLTGWLSSHWSWLDSPHKGPLTGIFDVFFDARLNKRLNNREVAGNLTPHGVNFLLFIKVTTMSFDDVLRKHTGESGRYQVLVIFAICIILVPDAFNTTELIFTTITPDFWPQGWLFSNIHILILIPGNIAMHLHSISFLHNEILHIAGIMRPDQQRYMRNRHDLFK